ncbi:LysR family transcriptional regulator ArgP [Myceligenerans salitolerans]|uniref:LysR family transcriptional regulator ArgP n=1 Tax=Myceligenerans salitolerans TaxID=1230528 RepID=A0ABS3I549_9MICO|nr:LysR family transcriptional regulator ArgP [Myceligenerans salitolerans]MBO0608149.1 LysR family transcriptional regulator ArgP [Myceligenerans salitolerans]
MRWDSAQLEALAAVVGEGSFEGAARVLHVTPSAVSQRIRALENAAGGVLVRRTRPVTPTVPGRTLLRLARQSDLLAAEAAAELHAAGLGPDLDGADGGRRAPRPVSVPIAINADSLATWVLPALARVPGVVLDIYREDQERTVDLLPQGIVMAAITAQAEPVQGCTSRPLGVMPYRAMATPAVLERWFPAGVTADALSRAPMLVFDRHDDLQDQWLREYSARTGSALPAPPRTYVPSTPEYLEALRLGLGWGMVQDLRTGPVLSGGDVVPLDPAAPSVDVRLYLQQWRLRSTTLDAVSDALLTEARRQLVQEH